VNTISEYLAGFPLVPPVFWISPVVPLTRALLCRLTPATAMLTAKAGASL